MKQHLPTAKLLALLLQLISALVLSACATVPRSSHSDAKLIVNQRNAQSGLVVNINVASADELEKLPGIGKVIAERIAAHRRQYGPFRRAEHLMMVPGISDAKFREIRSMIAVE